MRTDTVAICTDSHAFMDGIVKDVIPGHAEWPNRANARRYVRAGYEMFVHLTAKYQGVTEHRIRTIIGGPKPWQDAAADLF